ncbi:hypothetical protein [Sphingobium sp. R-21]|uniref:hypothetical protein n=1 Tax=Sphingobium sp. R-21 TaxID=3404056 RepID=UPI003CF077A0
MRMLMLAGLAALAACGSRENREPSNGIAAGNEAEQKASSDTAVSLPAPAVAVTPVDITMPQFAPQYPGSTIQSVNSATAGGGDSHEVRLLTNDDADRIFAFYRDSFAAAGLRKTSEFMSGGTGMMSATGKGRNASIAIARDQGRSVIIVTYSGE